MKEIQQIIQFLRSKTANMSVGEVSDVCTLLTQVDKAIEEKESPKKKKGDKLSK